MIPYYRIIITLSPAHLKSVSIWIFYGYDEYWKAPAWQILQTAFFAEAKHDGRCFAEYRTGR